MSYQITMPKFGLTMTEGTVTKWLKSVGEQVSKSEPLMEVETEKITNVVEAPADGVLKEQTAVEGEVYPVGAVLGVIE